MLLGDRILVVGDSRLMLEVLGRVLGPHCSRMFFASSYREALQQFEQNFGIGTVICDVLLPDGNGFQLLEQLASVPTPIPKVLLITARWVEDDLQRALALGAVGYLPKPVSMRDIRAALTMPANPQPRAPRHLSLAEAWILDPDWRERLVRMGIHDISTTGALLDSPGLLPVGTELEFEIVYDKDETVRIKATVVRPQEPSWLDSGGTAVHFDWVESRKRLEQFIRLHDRILAYG